MLVNNSKKKKQGNVDNTPIPESKVLVENPASLFSGVNKSHYFMRKIKIKAGVSSSGWVIQLAGASFRWSKRSDLIPMKADIWVVGSIPSWGTYRIISLIDVSLSPHPSLSD